MEEYIDEINSKGDTIATHPRSLLKTRKFLHKVSLIIPISSDGKFILTKRAKTKFPFPDTWCCGVGGNVRSGELEEEAALREAWEEIGFAFPMQKVSSTLYDQEDEKALFTVFVSAVPISVSDFKLDPAEIQCASAFTPYEIKQMIRENKDQFAPTFLAVLDDFLKALK